MKFDVLTVHSGLFPDFLQHGVIGRANRKGLIEVVIHDLRDFASGRQRMTDDSPYGGGEGMVMKPEPIFRAYDEVNLLRSGTVILLTPQGRIFNHSWALELSRRNHLILICGRYEGVDERVRTHLVDEELSIGDFILSGGELAAMVVIDSVSRMIPGVLGNRESIENESLTRGLLKHPQYTRPREFRGIKVPGVLLSGNHELIRRWRREESLKKTLKRRPDLLGSAALSKEEMDDLQTIKARLNTGDDAE